MAVTAPCALPLHSTEHLEPETQHFYCQALSTLAEAEIPFLVGGAYAFERYVGIPRHTKDFDIFVRPRDAQRVLDLLAERGFPSDMVFPHWLGKALCGDDFVDVIFSSGNGTCPVDESWFEHGVDDIVLGMPVKLVPAEEMIWQKAMIMERERYDGADVAHVLRAQADRLDWPRLLQRFDEHWRVLFSHLVLFGFVYPTDRNKVPRKVMDGLIRRLRAEMREPAADEELCQGTLLSREQYLIDVGAWGMRDARLKPAGKMSKREVAHWTAAIERK
jgi:hypothetical protein